MRLYVLRHGIAIEREDPECPVDPERPLTPEGVERTRMALHGLVTLGTRVDCIHTSPYLRAQQTAELAGEALSVPKMQIETVAWLAPETPAEETAAAIRALEVASTLVVGHAPLLDDLVAALLAVPEPVTRLKKAGCAVLEWKFTSNRARLLGVYEPKALRALGRPK
ncbi:MAG: phosphohistidine phosphatase SixA [Myxococcales bacterium]|nr:phosphohistidine phosphatase SixA [Myxococcales bacterium]